MKAANTPALADAMWALNAGSLLHRIPWQKGRTYYSICQRYAEYVMQYYTEKLLCLMDVRMGYQQRTLKNLRAND